MQRTLPRSHHRRLEVVVRLLANRKINWQQQRVCPSRAVDFRSKPRKFGVGGNPLDYRVSFCFQAGAQSRLNLLVVTSGLVKFLLGFVEDFELYEG